MTSSTQAVDGSLGWLGNLWERSWLKGWLLLIAVIFVYQPVWHGKPIWDDDAHLTPPGLRSSQGLARIWIEPGATQQYYPLVHSIFWVEYKLWGDSTLGYHLINILLHTFSALLLWKILRRLQVPGAYLAAAIFALHPVCVESVAWISEIKNTLSGAFYLSAALVYLRFDRTRNWRFYFVTLGLFLLGLMSKTVIATLPAALLVVFWWQRGKLSWKQDVLPLIPFFVAGIGAGLFTAWVEWKFVGARGSGYNFSVIERLLIAGRAIWFYLGKLVWPVDLVFIYPRWHVSQTVWWQYLFPITALLVSAGLWLLSRRNRAPLAAWLFFGGTLFPALGFFNVYPFCYSFVADHFQYLAGVGPITLAAAGIAIYFRSLMNKQQFLEPIVCGTLLLVLGVSSWRHSGMYTDIETLWRTTIARNPDCWLANNNLGSCLYKEERVEEAVEHYQKAIECKPDYPEAHYNLGLVFWRQGKLDEAIEHYQKAVELEPARAEYYINLGNLLAIQERPSEAIRQFQKALAVEPGYTKAHYNLADIFFAQGRWDEAIEHYQQALKQMPDSVHAYYQLGLALQSRGRFAEAVAQLQKVLELDPKHIPAQNNLAWLLATCPDGALRDGKKAVALAQQAVQLSGGNAPEILDTLAAAYAEDGNFPEAVATAQRAVDLSAAQNKKNLAEIIQNQLKLFEINAPFHEKP
jgi:tetratricopeptide (TPR) repeat protein